jgi:hypothetical protein
VITPVPRVPPRKRKGSHYPGADRELLLQWREFEREGFTKEEFGRIAQANYYQKIRKPLKPTIIEPGSIIWEPLKGNPPQPSSIVRKLNRLLAQERKTAQTKNDT